MSVSAPYKVEDSREILQNQRSWYTGDLKSHGKYGEFGGSRRKEHVCSDRQGCGFVTDASREEKLEGLFQRDEKTIMANLVALEGKPLDCEEPGRFKETVVTHFRNYQVTHLQ